jgi:hypothetical protein
MIEQLVDLFDKESNKVPASRQKEIAMTRASS